VHGTHDFSRYSRVCLTSHIIPALGKYNIYIRFPSAAIVVILCFAIFRRPYNIYIFFSLRYIMFSVRDRLVREITLISRRRNNPRGPVVIAAARIHGQWGRRSVRPTYGSVVTRRRGASETECLKSAEPRTEVRMVRIANVRKSAATGRTVGPRGRARNFRTGEKKEKKTEGGESKEIYTEEEKSVYTAVP